MQLCLMLDRQRREMRVDREIAAGSERLQQSEEDLGMRGLDVRNDHRRSFGAFFGVELVDELVHPIQINVWLDAQRLWTNLEGRRFGRPRRQAQAARSASLTIAFNPRRVRRISLPPLRRRPDPASASSSVDHRDAADT
jgi:hypothetical protein